jgi:hypothetical protein
VAGVVDDHRVGLGKRLKPRRKIGGRANHFVFVRHVPADRVADEH